MNLAIRTDAQKRLRALLARARKAGVRARSLILNGVAARRAEPRRPPASRGPRGPGDARPDRGREALRRQRRARGSSRRRAAPCSRSGATRLAREAVVESAVAAPARPASWVSGRAGRWLLWLRVVAALAVGLRLTVLRPARVPVTVFRAATGRVEETVTNSKAGTVKSRRRAELSPEVGGRVRELPARKGARVRRGDVLMRIADADYRAQVDLQESALEAARSARVEACRTAEQPSASSRATGALARADRLDRSCSTSCRAGATRPRRRARRRGRGSARREAGSRPRGSTSRRRCSARPSTASSPSSTTEVGEWITPSPPGLPIPPVIELIDPASIYVSAPMDEVDVGTVAGGPAGRASRSTPIPGRSSRPGHAGRALRARRPGAEPRPSRSRSSSTTPPSRATLLPGTSADVEVILERARRRAPDPDAPRCSRATRARRRAAAGSSPRRSSTGLRNWEFAEVRTGLAAGDARRRLARPRRGQGGRPRRRSAAERRGDRAVAASRATSTSAAGPSTPSRAIDLTIRATASYVSIMGPSGSGKSTLLNILGCLDRPTTGSLPARRPRGRAASTTTSSRASGGTGSASSSSSTTSCRG